MDTIKFKITYAVQIVFRWGGADLNPIYLSGLDFPLASPGYCSPTELPTSPQSPGCFCSVPSLMHLLCSRCLPSSVRQNHRSHGPNLSSRISSPDKDSTPSFGLHCSMQGFLLLLPICKAPYHPDGHPGKSKSVWPRGLENLGLDPAARGLQKAPGW